MAKNDKTPDSVSHKSEFVLGIPLVAERTTIKKDDETYTGYGWSREEADKRAGEKYSRGDKDE